MTIFWMAKDKWDSLPFDRLPPSETGLESLPAIRLIEKDFVQYTIQQAIYVPEEFVTKYGVLVHRIPPKE